MLGDTMHVNPTTMPCYCCGEPSSQVANLYTAYISCMGHLVGREVVGHRYGCAAHIPLSDDINEITVA